MPETIDCPKCQRKLRVPEELMGQAVQCPTCGAMFTAATPAPARPTGPVFTEETPWEQRAREKKAPPYIPAHEVEGQVPEGYGNWERFPRRRLDALPHRGALILTLGILSLVICGFLGPVAWIMGNNDLKEIKSGRMDREGEGLTQAGRICGIIATIFMVVGCVFYCAIFGMMGMGGAFK